MFDDWYPKPQTKIRMFEEIMHLLLGGASDSEVVGLAPARMVVIETDGSIEQEDTLKVAYDGAAATGLHVARDPLDAALLLPQIVARQIGDQALAAQCRACPSARSAEAAFTPIGTARAPASSTHRCTALTSWLSSVTSGNGCEPTSPPAAAAGGSPG